MPEGPPGQGEVPRCSGFLARRGQWGGLRRHLQLGCVRTECTQRRQTVESLPRRGRCEFLSRGRQWRALQRLNQWQLLRLRPEVNDVWTVRLPNAPA